MPMPNMSRSGSTSPIALITGAGGGIGGAVVERLLDDGYRVIVADLDEDSANVTVERLGGARDSVLAATVDVADRAAVGDLMTRIEASFGGLDLLINNAGYAEPSPLAELDPAAWDRMLAVHLTGTFNCCQAAYPLLADSAHAAVVNMASIAARVGIAGRGSYCAAKAGIEGLTRELAIEWAPRIRVNAVAPGLVKTPLVERVAADGIYDLASMESGIPARRLCRPEEVAAVVAFLGSGDAGYITGQSLVVDGGLTVDWRI
jgi:NAD(P)-dependent dehydrogenase (short-subunit alcohol dehydrogenase family)